MTKAIELRKISKKGRSIFALKNFKKREIIEVCPVIYLSSKDRKKCDQTVLAYYIYPWKNTRCACIVLGYGSIYNHAYDANADWEIDFKNKNMIYKVAKPIKKGEEITVNYNGDNDDKKEIDWFEVK